MLGRPNKTSAAYCCRRFCISELATKLPSIYTITACARIIIEAGQTAHAPASQPPNLSWDVSASNRRLT